MASEFLCFCCGARNYMPKGWGRIRAKCMNCSTPLIAIEKEASLGSSGSFLFKLLVLLFVVGVSYLSFVGWRNGETVLSIKFLFKQQGFS